MRIRRLLAWSLTWVMTACGGGGATPAPPPAGQAFWLPFAGYSQSGAALQWSLGVIPSTLSGSAATLQAVPIGQFKRTIGVLAKSTTVNASPSTPFAVVYLASGSDGNYHLYSLELADASAVPVPKQISSLSIPPSLASCLTAVYPLPSRSDLQDPSATAYVLMGAGAAPGATACASTPLLLVHYTDSATTVPIVLPASVTALPVATLCSSAGLLSGLIALDAAHNLTLYRTIDDWRGSANAVPIASGVALGNGGVTVTYDRAGRPRPEGCTLFLTALDLATGDSLLYRIDSAGNAVLVYRSSGQLQFGLDAVDNTDVYFMDAATVGSQTSYTLVRQPIDGSPSTALYTSTPTPSTQWYAPFDTDGTNVILYFVDDSTTPARVSLLTVPANTPSLPTLLAGSVQSAFLDFPTDQLFVTQVSGLGALLASVYAPSNPVPLMSEPNSAFLLRYDRWESSGRVIQLKGVASDGTYGGAGVYSVTTRTLTATPLTQNALPYVVPAGTTSLNLSPVSATLVYGDIQTSSTSSGLVVDYSKNNVVTISAATGEKLVPFYGVILTP